MPIVTVICRFAIKPEHLQAIDRMAAQAGKSRDQLIADFATILAECEKPPREVSRADA